MAGSAVIGQLRALLIADTAQFDSAMAGATVDVKKLANTIEKDLAGSQSRVNALVRQFGGSDVIGRAKDYAKAVEAAGGAANLTAKHQEQVNQKVNQALAHYKALGQQAPPHLIALANATKQVQVPTAQLGGGMDALMGKARALAGVFGVTLGAGALVSFGKSVFKSAEEINDLSLKMGVSIDAAQRFKFAARQSGAEIEDVSRAIVKMSDNLAGGDKSTVDALTKAGLSFDKIRALKPEDAFRQIADAIGRIPDPMDQANVAMDLFGKSGSVILPMIRENSLSAADGIKTMSEETVKSLEQAKQAWNDFWDSVTVVTGEALADILPQIKQMLADLRKGFSFLAAFAETMKKTGRVDVALGVAFGSGLGEFVTQQEAELKRLRKLAGDQIVGDTSDSKDAFARVMTGPTAPKKRLTLAEEDAEKKRDEDAKKRREQAIGQAQRMEEAYQAWARAALGLSDKEKELLGWETRLIHELSVKAQQTKAVESTLKGLTTETQNQIKSAILLGKSAKDIAKEFKVSETSIRAYQDQLKSATQVSTLLIKAMPIKNTFDDLTKGTAIYGKALDKMGEDAKKAGEHIARMQGSLSLIKPTDWNAIFKNAIPVRQLSDNVFADADFRQAIANADKLNTKFSITSTLLQVLGQSSTGAFRSVIGVTAQATSAIGQYVVAMKKATAANDSVAKSVASLDLAMSVGTLGMNIFASALGMAFSQAEEDRQSALRAAEAVRLLKEEITGLGGASATLQEFEQITGRRLGTGNNFLFGPTYTKYLKEAAAILQDLPDRMRALTDVTQKFGGVVPSSLRPAVAELLKMSGLSADLRKQLEAMAGQPSWQVLEDRAKALGIELSSLGAGFSQARIKDIALGYVRDLTMFSEAGADVDGVLKGMADELLTLVQEAKKTGAALPKTLEPYIKKWIDLGLAIDENGNAIDIGALSFADFEDTALTAMKDLLTEIKDILAKAFPAAAQVAADGINRAFAGIRRPTSPALSDPDAYQLMGRDIPRSSWAAQIPLPSPDVPTWSFQQPTLGESPMLQSSAAFAGTAPSLASSSPTNINLYVTDTVSFEQFLRSGGAGAVVRTVDEVVQRWGGAR